MPSPEPKAPTLDECIKEQEYRFDRSCAAIEEEILKHLRRLRDVEAGAGQWISIDDRYPDCNTTVLLYDKMFDRIDYVEILLEPESIDPDYTHWMIPAKPKG